MTDDTPETNENATTPEFHNEDGSADFIINTPVPPVATGPAFEAQRYLKLARAYGPNSVLARDALLRASRGHETPELEAQRLRARHESDQAARDARAPSDREAFYIDQRTIEPAVGLLSEVAEPRESWIQRARQRLPTIQQPPPDMVKAGRRTTRGSS